MKYFYVEFEVAGNIGDNADVDWNTHPPRIERLHYEFDTWLGDALLEAFLCLIATEEAAAALKAAGVTGVAYDAVEVSTTETFREFHPDQGLPPFVWLRVNGVAGEDDFGVYRDMRGERPQHKFVLSERALDILRPFGLNYAEIEPFP